MLSSKTSKVKCGLARLTSNFPNINKSFLKEQGTKGKNKKMPNSLKISIKPILKHPV